jgi:hypothetical protein
LPVDTVAVEGLMPPPVPDVALTEKVCGKVEFPAEPPDPPPPQAVAASMANIAQPTAATLVESLIAVSIPDFKVILIAWSCILPLPSNTCEATASEWSPSARFLTHRERLLLAEAV